MTGLTLELADRWAEASDGQYTTAQIGDQLFQGEPFQQSQDLWGLEEDFHNDSARIYICLYSKRAEDCR